MPLSPLHRPISVPLTATDRLHDNLPQRIHKQGYSTLGGSVISSLNQGCSTLGASSLAARNEVVPLLVALFLVARIGVVPLLVALSLTARIEDIGVGIVWLFLGSCYRVSRIPYSSLSDSFDPRGNILSELLSIVHGLF
uniref:Uncharacterized protein n=1 Tax=Fagus sylvatica TaxID=28930 RepID=A0A2N9HTJ3_FAGSY